MINGQPPVPPPDIPEERLNMPAIPLPDAVDTRRPSSDHVGFDRPGHRRAASSTSEQSSSQHRPAAGRSTARSRPPRTAPSDPPPRAAAAGQHVPQRHRRPHRPPPRCTASARGSAAARRRRRHRRRARRAAAGARAGTGAGTAAAGAVAGGRADEPATVRRAGVRCARPDPARAGRGDRQRRRAGRGPPPRGARPARPLRGHRADRTGFLRTPVRCPTPSRSTATRCSTSATSEDEVVDEVAITVIHEIAHHFGIDDERLHELGWA